MDMRNECNAVNIVNLACIQLKTLDAYIHAVKRNKFRHSSPLYAEEGRQLEESLRTVERILMTLHSCCNIYAEWWMTGRSKSAYCAKQMHASLFFQALY